MKEPVDHIARPMLPWRSGSDITECGYNAASVSTLTREDYLRRVTDLGKQRAAMVTCMTCAQTAARWGTWEDDPRRAVSREIEWETAWCRTDRGQRLRDELSAIALLIENHRDEFHAQVEAIEQRRAWIAQKAARPKVVPSKARGL